MSRDIIEDPTAPAADPGTIPGLDPGLAARLADGLERVEQRLSQVVSFEDDFLAHAGGYLAQAGGKRFRPMLTLLAADLGPAGITDEVIEAAVGVELTHLASLYHDDVMDEAELRRGVTSANLAFGNATAILVGDLLFGTASQVIAGLGAEAVKIQADTFVRLCSGQIRDDRPRPEGADQVTYYLRVLADKTGSLIATSARYGAIFSGADEAAVATLTAFGEKIGVVFQLADDLLDIASEADSSGKTPGTDLREGKATLPVLFVRQGGQSEDADLIEITHAPITDPEALSATLRRVRSHPAMDQARRATLEQADQARALLEPLGDAPAAEALRAMVDGIALRSS